MCERSQGEEWEGGGEKRVGAVRRKSEEEVYTLLFKEVDSEGRGEVAVESLVDYLHQIQLGSAQSHQEDVYDSHEDVSVILSLTAVVLPLFPTGVPGQIQPAAIEGHARRGGNIYVHFSPDCMR